MIAYSVMEERQQQPHQTEPFYRYVSPDGSTRMESLRLDAGYVVRFPGLADFEVSRDGTSVTCHPSPGTDPFTVEHLYINIVRPLSLSRQGRLAFHASAVTVPGGAIAFLGRSGMGKSTLATFFASRGASFLTDDGLVLSRSGDGYQVWPNHPSIRLWDDSREALLGGDVDLAPPVSFTSKARVLAGAGLPHCDQPQRLLSAWVLAEPESGDIVIRRASPVESVLGWIRNSFLMDSDDPGMLSQQFQNATLVGHAVPAYVLDYPRSFDRLADVQAAIMQHVTEQANTEELRDER